jgi:PIN domain nuclease of toxin-antitoxin system
VTLLLDTHAFLWWSTASRKLGAQARRAIAGADDVYVSAASGWEVAIKIALGRLVMEIAFEDAVTANEFRQLPVVFSHAAAAGLLPAHHADPFDRMLIAQAQVEGFTVVTHDRQFEAYDVAVVWT